MSFENCNTPTQNTAMGRKSWSGLYEEGDTFIMSIQAGQDRTPGSQLGHNWALRWHRKGLKATPGPEQSHPEGPLPSLCPALVQQRAVLGSPRLCGHSCPSVPHALGAVPGIVAQWLCRCFTNGGGRGPSIPSS